MKGASRFFSVLTYAAMVYAIFTALVAALVLSATKYAHFGWMILAFSAVGFLAMIVLNVFKLKWTSFFALTGTTLARVYVSYLLITRSGLEMLVFYKQHLPALLVILFALFSTLFYKKYLKNERGITFQKTAKDRELMEEKQAFAEAEAEALEGTEKASEETAEPTEEASETELAE